jgi:hypothetical protein
MKRFIYRLAGLLAVLSLAMGASIANPTSGGATPDTPDAPAHTQSQVDAVCLWIEVATFGPNPNGIAEKSLPRHYWNRHQADCCYWSSSRNYAEVLYDIGNGSTAWITPHAWCAWAAATNDHD